VDSLVFIVKVPSPIPDSGETEEIQEGKEETSILHEVLLFISISEFPAVYANSSEEGVNARLTAFCDNEMLAEAPPPEIVRIELFTAPVVLAPADTDTVAVPFPLDGLTVKSEEDVVAVHFTLDVTLNDAEVPSFGIERVVTSVVIEALSLFEHAASDIIIIRNDNPTGPNAANFLIL
jgi:hypothetical protein